MAVVGHTSCALRSPFGSLHATVMCSLSVLRAATVAEMRQGTPLGDVA